MDIKDDKLVVTPKQFVLDDKGNTIEAEQAPAARRLDGTGSVSAPGITEGASLPISIEMPMTAGEMATTMRSRCAFCRHFDPTAAQKLISQADSPAAPIELRKQVNDMRAYLISTGNADVYGAAMDDDGTLDVEAALASLGTCRALTEHENELVFVHPLAGCPQEVCTPSAPHGFFEDIEQTDRRGAAIYDRILKAADGGEL